MAKAPPNQKFGVSGELLVGAQNATEHLFMNPRSLCCVVPGSSGADVGHLALFLLPSDLRFKIISTDTMFTALLEMHPSSPEGASSLSAFLGNSPTSCTTPLCYCGLSPLE